MNLLINNRHSVYLNYPYHKEFIPLSYAMQFTVVAAGLVPVSAKDFSTPDVVRLPTLVEAMMNCHYSAHDLSQYRGLGDNNFARFNMPLEMGMALFYAFSTQHAAHRCVFFVSTPHDYKEFASNLAGLDPKCHENKEEKLIAEMYNWLHTMAQDSAPTLAVFNMISPAEIQNKYDHFKQQLQKVDGSGDDGRPTHFESRELMYSICTECGWWDWRKNKAGEVQFPKIPLSWKT